MEVQPDFRDLLALFNAHRIEYMVVGSYALAFYGAPRYTGVIDLFVRPYPENARRILAALDDFGFGTVGLTDKDFSSPDQVVQLGVPPVRIDIMTSLTEVSLEEAFSSCVDGMYGDIPVKYIGRAEFIANKQATGRKKDLADIEALGEE